MQPLPALSPVFLAACIASCCAAFAGASLGQTPAQTLPPPKEKGPISIDADRIEGVLDIEVSARGKAELRQDERTIFGDRFWTTP